MHAQIPDAPFDRVVAQSLRKRRPSVHYLFQRPFVFLIFHRRRDRLPVKRRAAPRSVPPAIGCIFPALRRCLPSAPRDPACFPPRRAAWPPSPARAPLFPSPSEPAAPPDQTRGTGKGPAVLRFGIGARPVKGLRQRVFRREIRLMSRFGHVSHNTRRRLCAASALSASARRRDAMQFLCAFVPNAASKSVRFSDTGANGSILASSPNRARIAFGRGARPPASAKRNAARRSRHPQNTGSRRATRSRPAAPAD